MECSTWCVFAHTHTHKHTHTHTCTNIRMHVNNSSQFVIKWCLKTLFPRLLLTKCRKSSVLSQKARKCSTRLLAYYRSQKCGKCSCLLLVVRNVAHVLAYYWLSETWHMFLLTTGCQKRGTCSCLLLVVRNVAHSCLLLVVRNVAHVLAYYWLSETWHMFLLTTGCQKRGTCSCLLLVVRNVAHERLYLLLVKLTYLHKDSKFLRAFHLPSVNNLSG